MRQEKYLLGVERAESNEHSAAQIAMTRFFREKGSTTPGPDLEKSVVNLETGPLTVTFKPQDLFGPTKHITTYKNFFEVFSQNKQVKEVLPSLQSTEELSKFQDNPLGRGGGYGQWRLEKDEGALGDTALEASDLPVFGAINMGFVKNKGLNYYGDFHFLLKPSIRKRSAFTCSTTPPERRDMTLLLDDMRKRHKDNEILQIRDGTYSLVDIEVHVFGQIDLKQDVEAVYVPPQLNLVESDIRGTHDVFSPSLGMIKNVPDETVPEILRDLIPLRLAKRQG